MHEIPWLTLTVVAKPIALPPDPPAVPNSIDDPRPKEN